MRSATRSGSAVGPTIVCAQAGNVNTGASDPLAEIARPARTPRRWLHVDGAFGLWAAASPRFSHLVAGAERADSWATDAHKWLNVPYDCGVVFCRHPDAHAEAMAVSASYLQRGGGPQPVRLGARVVRVAREGSRSGRRCARSAAAGSRSWSTGAATTRADLRAVLSAEPASRS